MTQERFTEAVVDMQATLYRVSASLLRQLCDQEDAVQSAIEKAWRKRNSLRDADKFKGWMCRILINECYTLLRRQKWELIGEDMEQIPAPPDSDPDLYRFFQGLPEKLRLPMVLHYVEGCSLEEIAQTLRLPLGTVKSRLSRGRDKMREDPYLKEAIIDEHRF